MEETGQTKSFMNKVSPEIANKAIKQGFCSSLSNFFTLPKIILSVILLGGATIIAIVVPLTDTVLKKYHQIIEKVRTDDSNQTNVTVTPAIPNISHLITTLPTKVPVSENPTTIHMQTDGMNGRTDATSIGLGSQSTTNGVSRSTNFNDSVTNDKYTPRNESSAAEISALTTRTTDGNVFSINDTREATPSTPSPNSVNLAIKNTTIVVLTNTATSSSSGTTNTSVPSTPEDTTNGLNDIFTNETIITTNINATHISVTSVTTQISSLTDNDVSPGTTVSDTSQFSGSKHTQNAAVTSSSQADLVGSTFRTQHTSSHVPPDFQRTVIFIYVDEDSTENIFLRGGATTQISIIHRSPGIGSYYEKYNIWSQGDDFLDWTDLEPGQSQYLGQDASGTPMVWTTNQTTGHPGYQPLNRYGDGYWMVDVYMNCSQITSGWFQAKTYIAQRASPWEGDVSQGTSTCGGDFVAPFMSEGGINHLAYCGKINVFRFEESWCIIDNFPQDGATSGVDAHSTNRMSLLPTRDDATTVTTPTTSQRPDTTMLVTTISATNPSTQNPIQRTIIFMSWRSSPSSGSPVFLRGGISNTRRSGCGGEQAAENDPCSIPIVQYSPVPQGGSNFGDYVVWSQGDSHLDWNGEQNGQGVVEGPVANADGSPMVSTSNSPQNTQRYISYNIYGDSYEMWDVLLDCSATENGWFEFKGKQDGNWESDISQDVVCTGTAGGSRPYLTGNHFGRCGKVNIVSRNQNGCIIDDVSSE